MFTYTESDQHILHKSKAVHHRRAYMIREFLRGRACSAFAAVYRDKIGLYIQLDHRPANADELAFFTDTQFYADRLPRR